MPSSLPYAFPDDTSPLFLGDFNLSHGVDETTLSRLLHLTAVAATLLKVPMAVLVVARAGAWQVVARHGLAVAELPALTPEWFVWADGGGGEPQALVHPWSARVPRLRATACLPWVNEHGDTAGALCVMDVRPGTPWHAEQLAGLAGLARVVVDVLQLQAEQRLALERCQALEQAHGWLLESVAQDPLTQVANRRALMAFLDKTQALARREHQPLSVLLLDIRTFKRINEQYGDAAGDHVLNEVATRMAACARGSELVGRMSGDEFMAVLYPCTPEQAALAAERYAAALQNHPIELGAKGGASVHVRIAAICASMAFDAPQTPDELYRLAAKALDEVKQRLHA